MEGLFRTAFACVAAFNAPADNLPYAESRPHGAFVSLLRKAIMYTTNREI